MNMDIDQSHWDQGHWGQDHRAVAGDGEKRSRPDWHALHARLGAIHAARNSLAEQEQTGLAGSFEARCAAALAGFGSGLASVNPDALVNRKRANGKDTAAAGAQSSGSRG